MRIFTKHLSRSSGKLAIIVMLSISTLLLNSCVKDDKTAPAVSGLMVVNASPGLGTYNLYWGTTKINNAAMPFLSSIAYFQITPGVNTLKFTTANSIESVLTKDLTLEAEKAYSLFLINEVPNLDGLLVKDDLSPTSSDKAFIRFINLSPDAPALDLVQTGGASLITDKAFKSVSDFTLADAKTYSFDVKNKETGAVIATLKDISLTAGSMYTITVCGMLSPTEHQEPARIQVYVNR